MIPVFYVRITKQSYSRTIINGTILSSIKDTLYAIEHNNDAFGLCVPMGIVYPMVLLKLFETCHSN